MKPPSSSFRCHLLPITGVLVVIFWLCGKRESFGKGHFWLSRVDVARKLGCRSRVHRAYEIVNMAKAENTSDSDEC